VRSSGYTVIAINVRFERNTAKSNIDVTTNLDDVLHPQGNGYDIGAYEFRRFSIFLPMVVKQ
jgi:hypothetical protein